MKYRLSFHQIYPFYLGIIGIQFLYIIAILNFIYGVWYLSIILIIMSILFSIPMRRLSMALCSVIFTEEGVSVESKKGKKRIFLKWEDIKVYTVTADVQYGGQYICLSSNVDLKEYKTYFF